MTAKTYKSKSNGKSEKQRQKQWQPAMETAFHAMEGRAWAELLRGGWMRGCGPFWAGNGMGHGRRRRGCGP
jgi:hypothetical protein